MDVKASLARCTSRGHSEHAPPEMSGDAPTPAAGSSIWNQNGLLDPASLRHSSLMAPPTMNGSGDQLNSYENSRLFVVCGKSVEVRY